MDYNLMVRLKKKSACQLVTGASPSFLVFVESGERLWRAGETIKKLFK